jgi:tetratricopeptide (TPR) repeat protein
MNRTKKKATQFNTQAQKTANQSKRPTISLCMIVKNEEKYLAGCLESVRELVDEIIIVDTGSTDSTMQIAESFGARIYHFDWVNDFAAARNESLAHATGDWILYLDADERIEAKHHTAVKKAVQNKIDVALYFLRITGQNGVGDSSRMMTHTYPRLFKNIPGIKFEGAVHEQIIPAFKRLGKVADYCVAVITHLGYAIEGDDEQRKYQRNLDLLLSQVEETPEQFFLHFNLGRTYIGLRQYDKGMQALEHALTLHDSTSAQHLRANAHLVIGQLRLRLKNDPDGAIEAAKLALEQDATLLPAKRLMAEAYFNKNQFKESATSYEEAIELCQATPVEWALCDHAAPDPDNLYESMAVSQIKAGDYEDALRSLKKSLALNPKKTGCYFHMGDALLHLGKYQNALNALKRYLAEDETKALRLKALYACTAASLKLENSQQAEQYLRESQELAPELLSATTDFINLLRKENRLTVALDYLRALPDKVSSSVKVLRLQCSLMDELGQWKDLLHICDQLKDAEGESAFVMTYRGKALENMEQGEMALQCYERAVSLDAEYGPAWEAIGTYCLTNGNYQMALECLQMAFNLGLQTADMCKLLGLASAAVGDRLAAQRYFKQTLAVNPSDQFAASQLQTLAATA